MRPLIHGALISIVGLLVAACGGNPTPPPHTPTPAIEVVEFTTEKTTPTSTRINTPTPFPSPTPTRIPTSDAGAETAAMEESALEVSGPAAFGLTRPPNQNPLTGLPVDDPALLQRRPLMVRIGDDPAARPQVGLNEADMVYEELVEWWITRFTAIYLSRDLEMIAPIRSMRLINLQLTPQYQGALAHSGGSDPVRFRMSQTNIPDLDEFFHPSIYFYRDTDHWATRLALDATQARAYMQEQGLEQAVPLRGFVFRQTLNLDNLPADAVGAARDIGISYPAPSSQVRWTYDEAGGHYRRSVAGEAMVDADGDPISATNVIIYFTEHNETDIVEDSTGATSVEIAANGFGTAWVLRDGLILQGNWETDGSQTPNFIFNDETPIPLKPGNSWVQVVPLAYEIDIGGQLYSRLSRVDTGIETNAAGEPAVTPEPEEDPPASPTPIGAQATATPAGE